MRKNYSHVPEETSSENGNDLPKVVELITCGIAFSAARVQRRRVTWTETAEALSKTFKNLKNHGELKIIGEE